MTLGASTTMKKCLKDGLLGATDGFYRARNRKKTRVLVYADSRGLNLASPLGKTGYETYVWQLRRNYHLAYSLCPEKYTTIIDFIEFMRRHDASLFDAVVCHCGIVDFSPRPLSSLDQVKQSKAGIRGYDELFEANEDYYRRPFVETYFGEQTINLYSEEYLTERVLPRLLEIPRLIWLNSSRVLPGWDGNYHRGRPANLDEVVSRFDAAMMAGLPDYVDLKGWSPEEIKKLTIDNVHFTAAGFRCVAQRIEAAIERGV